MKTFFAFLLGFCINLTAQEPGDITPGLKNHSSEVDESIWRTKIINSLPTITKKVSPGEEEEIPVVARGFAVTCMEYLLKGIGAKCLADTKANWNSVDKILEFDPTILDTLVGFLLPNGKAPDGIQPTIRISLNAGYYLGEPTYNWKWPCFQNPGPHQWVMWETLDTIQNNPETYEQIPFTTDDWKDRYQTLVDTTIAQFTKAGIVVIIDLHWNNDVDEQLIGGASMARSGSGPFDGAGGQYHSGDSIQFWDAIAKKYGSNPLVWYELFNEPHDITYDTWLNGGTDNNITFTGMSEMYNTIRTHTQNPVIIAGTNWAYTQDGGCPEDGCQFKEVYVEKFDETIKPTNVIYNLHPYAGKDQENDLGKNANNFKILATQIQQQTKKPVIITEFGQFNCGSGKCYNYSGVFNGQPMSYNTAILQIAQENNISWSPWAWRPNTPSDPSQPSPPVGGEQANCWGPDVNNGSQLITPFKDDQGADWKTLWHEFYNKPI